MGGTIWWSQTPIRWNRLNMKANSESRPSTLYPYPWCCSWVWPEFRAITPPRELWNTVDLGKKRWYPSVALEITVLWGPLVLEGRSGAGEEVLRLNSSHSGPLPLSAFLGDLWGQRSLPLGRCSTSLLGTYFFKESVQGRSLVGASEKRQGANNFPANAHAHIWAEGKWPALSQTSGRVLGEPPELGWGKKTQHLHSLLDKCKMLTSGSNPWDRDHQWQRNRYRVFQDENEIISCEKYKQCFQELSSKPQIHELTKIHIY